MPDEALGKNCRNSSTSFLSLETALQNHRVFQDLPERMSKDYGKSPWTMALLECV